MYLWYNSVFILGGTMILKDYLRQNMVSVNKFAKLCGVPTPNMASYVYTNRIPRKNIMLRIFHVTGKKVTPNDFYLGKDEFQSD